MPVVGAESLRRAATTERAVGFTGAARSPPAPCSPLAWGLWVVRDGLGPVPDRAHLPRVQRNHAGIAGGAEQLDADAVGPRRLDPAGRGATVGEDLDGRRIEEHLEAQRAAAGQAQRPRFEVQHLLCAAD